MAQPWLSESISEEKLERLKNDEEALDYIMKTIHEWRMEKKHSSEVIMAYLTINQAHNNKWGNG